MRRFVALALAGAIGVGVVSFATADESVQTESAKIKPKKLSKKKYQNIEYVNTITTFDLPGTDQPPRGARTVLDFPKQFKFNYRKFPYCKTDAAGLETAATTEDAIAACGKKSVVSDPKGSTARVKVGGSGLIIDVQVTAFNDSNKELAAVLEADWRYRRAPGHDPDRQAEVVQEGQGSPAGHRYRPLQEVARRGHPAARCRCDPVLRGDDHEEHATSRRGASRRSCSGRPPPSSATAPRRRRTPTRRSASQSEGSDLAAGRSALAEPLGDPVADDLALILLQEVGGLRDHLGLRPADPLRERAAEIEGQHRVRVGPEQQCRAF